MPSQREKELDEEFARSLSPVLDAAKKPVIPDVPSKAGAAGLGLASGLTFGFSPQIAGGAMTGAGMWGDYPKARDEIAAKNQAAWDAHPLSYGTGYGAGAVGSTALTGGFGNVVRGGRALEGAAGAVSALSKAPVRAAIIQGIPRSFAADNNLPPDGGLMPNALRPPSSAAGAPSGPISMNEEKDNPYKKLTDFLASNTDPEDQESKRKLAMKLASSEGGRALSNGDSPNYEA